MMAALMHSNCMKHLRLAGWRTAQLLLQHLLLVWLLLLLLPWFMFNRPVFHKLLWVRPPKVCPKVTCWIRTV